MCDCPQLQLAELWLKDAHLIILIENNPFTPSWFYCKLKEEIFLHYPGPFPFLSQLVCMEPSGNVTAVILSPCLNNDDLRHLSLFLCLIWFCGVTLEAPGISGSSILTQCLYMYLFSFCITKRGTEITSWYGCRSSGSLTKWFEEFCIKSMSNSELCLLNAGWRVTDGPSEDAFLCKGSRWFMVDGNNCRKVRHNRFALFCCGIAHWSNSFFAVFLSAATPAKIDRRKSLSW